MGHRLSKIYTKTGDDGTTGLGDGSRTHKDDVRVNAYGTVDELNAAIGLLLAEPDLPDGVTNELLRIQHDLFDLGGELSIPDYTIIQADYVTRLEQWLDAHNANLPPLKNFILPGGSRTAALAHMARTICRRAERELVTLHQQTPINLHALHYLNRLSDYCFVLARALLKRQNKAEVLWQSPSRDSD